MKTFLIYLLLATSTTVCLAQKKESNTTKVLKQFEIIPDVITDDVPETLGVTFNSGAVVDMGNIIYPIQAKDQPAVDWNADENAFYCLICVDSDAPSPDNPFLSELNTWMVGNIRGKNIPSGDVLVEYIACSPPRGGDLHRSVFLLYKQPNRIQFDEKPIDKYTITGRPNFSIKAFASKYNFGSPEAANFYRSKFDNYVLEVYDQLKCCLELNKPE